MSQYRYDLTQMTFITEVQKIAQRRAEKSFTGVTKVLYTVSQFLFCAIGLTFILLHPSALFVVFLPILIVCFFIPKGRQLDSCSFYNLSTRLFFITAVAYTAILYGYHLYSL